ncbi:MAG: hypothetical protein ACQCN4_08080 [Candidatus Bathyarchaeia archaeon]
MADLVGWLLGGDPYVEYRTRLDLLEQKETEPEVVAAKNRMVEDPKIQQILQELENWPGAVLNSHKSASQSFHKLSFIADLGFTKEDPHISAIVDKIFEHQSEEGPFQLTANYPKHFGGTGEDVWAWALCDAPVTVYSLAKLGYANDARVQKAAAYLAGLVFPNGWHCTVSKELGKFRGPGKKDEPCPYATLATLKMLLQFDEWKNSQAAHYGAECLLYLWQNSLTMHPYIFYMGTDFRKLKAPFVWYDILHVLDVLSQCSWLKTDSRLLDMAGVVRSRADVEGKFTPQSEWQVWRGWDFGQKKQPSRWLTFLVTRAFKRLGTN